MCFFIMYAYVVTYIYARLVTYHLKNSIYFAILHRNFQLVIRLHYHWRIVHVQLVGQPCMMVLWSGIQILQAMEVTTHIHPNMVFTMPFNLEAIVMLHNHLVITCCYKVGYTNFAMVFQVKTFMIEISIWIIAICEFFLHQIQTYASFLQQFCASLGYN